MEITKWYTYTEWVDIHTGEIIRTENQHLYIKTKLLNFTTKQTKDGNYIKTNTYGCIRDGQLHFEFEGDNFGTDQQTRARNHALFNDYYRGRFLCSDGIIPPNRGVRNERRGQECNHESNLEQLNKRYDDHSRGDER